MEMLIPAAQKVGLQLLLEPQTSGVIFRAACTGAGVVYPAYQSFKAIEDKRDPTLNEQWLTYWAMWGLLSLAESTTDDILSKLPYYYHAKFALLLWLQMPSTQGARKVYSRYLRPQLLRYQPKVDICIDKLAAAVSMVYSIYRVPIDQVATLVMYGVGQAQAAIKWFTSTDGEGGSTSSSTSSSRPATGSGGAMQFISR